MPLFRRRRIGPLIGRADDAAARGDWTAARDLYAQILRERPERADLRVQYAHALKRTGDASAAIGAYRRAVDDQPALADALHHMAALLAEQGDRQAALAAYVELLGHDIGHEGASQALDDLGMLDALPAQLLRRLRDHHRACLQDRLDGLAKQAARVQALAVETLSHYDAMRPAMTMHPPKGAGEPLSVAIIIDARDSLPSFVRTTLMSLRACDHNGWRAIVIGSPAVLHHPVASLADIDSRMVFVAEANAPACAAQVHIHLSAGTHLDPMALAWIAFAFADPDVMACTSDWDHCVAQWDGPDRHFDPQLHGILDPDWLAATGFPPPLIALRTATPEQAVAVKALTPEGRRQTLLEQFGARHIVGHIPLPLASVTRMPARAEIAAEGDTPAPVWSLMPDGYPPSAGHIYPGGIEIAPRANRPATACGIVCDEDALIRIIIPTRDGADVLRTAVESLFVLAERPDALRLTILDNRSIEPETRALLSDLASRYDAQVIDYDHSFNWSLMNNLAVEQTDEPLLLFANNDIEMLSRGWDRRLRGQLQRDDTGIVGARLLYPDGSIQHAGMLLGLADGSPVHDGVFGALNDPQEDVRFDQSCAKAAVTGAFMAIRRDLFDAVGGFDAASFAIAYNDVDLCLAVRQRGFRVLYDPGLELIHFESRTRGFNDNRAKLAWDQGELRSLYRKWGDALRANPGLSPWWSRQRPYTELRPIGADDVVEHMAMSMRRDPWRIEPQEA